MAERLVSSQESAPARRPAPGEKPGAKPDRFPDPPPAQAREWLAMMMLIRRFEERAGEMYAKAKVGGFLHLGVGEEATIVGAARALRDSDYLISTYRSHGHALARGTSPDAVMAELFGRVDGCSRGRGGSMHMFDLKRRFMGGYGIVGGNLPLAAGMAMASDYLGTDDATLCTLGDGAANQGTFGETMNLAALWRLPVVFLVSNNQFGMGTSLARHSAVTDLHQRGEGFGVPGLSCDGMDVTDTFAVCTDALRHAREQRRPMLVEASTYRFRGHSMADPEEYRTREQVEHWRERDPIVSFSQRMVAAGALKQPELERLDAEAIERVDRAVAFADASPLPEPDSLYDDVYVLGDQVRGWYSVDARTPTPHRGEDERSMPLDQLPGGDGYEPTQTSSPAAPGGAIQGLASEAGDRPGAERGRPDRSTGEDPSGEIEGTG